MQLLVDVLQSVAIGLLSVSVMLLWMGVRDD